MKKNDFCFVLIRGLLRDKRHWGTFTSSLKNQFSDAEIIALDLPGNGSQNQQSSPCDIADYTEALRQQLPNRTNLNLIAISMGGMIAIDWMTRYPAEINSVVLINTSVKNYSSMFQRLRWDNYPAIFSLFFCSAKQREQKILALTSNHHGNDEELLKTWLRWQKQNPVANKNAFKQLFAAARFSVQTKPVHPMLIIAAKKDRLVDYRCSLKLNQVWRTDYQQHDSAGHDIPLDDPQWLSRVINDWVVNI